MWSLKKETNKKPQTKPQQWQKAPKNSLWHMLNVPLLLIATEDNFSFLCFRYREVSRLPCTSHYTATQTQQCSCICSFPPFPCYSSSHNGPQSSQATTIHLLHPEEHKGHLSRALQLCRKHKLLATAAEISESNPPAN